MLPVKVEAVTSDGEQVLDLHTVSLSAGGAFVITREIIAVGTDVRVTLTLSNERVKGLTGFQSRLEIIGKVIRSESTGLAICFNDQYQLLKLKPS